MKTYFYKTGKNKRAGIVDVWNSFMVENASFSENDIPICPSTASVPPTKLIGFDEAKKYHKQMIKTGQLDYHIDAFIHFFIDDKHFDGKQSGIWLYPFDALEILRHYSGIICPDYSTCADFPDPQFRWNIYRMNAFGFWIQDIGIPVISNVRWGVPKTWSYCFDGNPRESIIALGTVASSLKYSVNYPFFARGLINMAETLRPHTILVYGSANYPCFDELKEKGIKIIVFQSSTSKYFDGRDAHE